MAPLHRIPLFLLLIALPLAVAQARDTLGLYDDWGAFRDARPPRCFAIAEPARRSRDKAVRPFVTVSYWPAAGLRWQLYVRLRQVKKRGAPVYAVIADRRFLLASGGAQAWAPDAAADAAIVAAMRGAPSLSVVAIDLAGRPFADIYRLRGAATAIDAAALACAKGG